MENRKSKNVLLTIMGVLIVFEFVARFSIIHNYTFSGILELISIVFVVLYGFWLYKKPHGNMLKYAMIIFALAEMLSNISFLMGGAHDYACAAVVIASGAICYCAGRLGRIEQNKFLFPIIDIVLFGTCTWCLVSYNKGGFVNGFAFYDCFAVFTTLMIAYFVRFKEHKEAGLMDAPKE